MELINDVCLLKINKYLQLKDSIRLSQAFDRFRLLVQPMWCKQYEYMGNLYDFLLYAADLSEDETGYLLRNILEVIVTNEVTLFSPNLVNLISEYSFPNIQTLHFGSLFNNKDDDYVESVDLNVVFPNLCRLYVSENFDWNNSSLSKGLQELTIYLCPEFNHKHFMKILKELQLKSFIITCVENAQMDETKITDLQHICELESLFLPYECLPWILRMNFNNFKSLKQFRFEANSNICQEMINECLNKLEQIISDKTSIEMLLLGNISPLKSDANLLKRVEKLTISDIKYETMSVHLPALRELMLKDCVFEQAFDISSILRECQNLEFLNIEGCVFLAPQPTINVADLAINRTKVLRLNLWDNEYQNETLTFVGQNDLFIESNEKIEKLNEEKNSFIFELTNRYFG